MHVFNGDMTRFNSNKVIARVAVWVVGFNTVVAAGTVKININGLIVGRSADEMIVQLGSGAELAFLLTDSTQVAQIRRTFQSAQEKMTMLKHTRSI